MANSETLTSGVTERYASALFDLAVAEKKLPAVEKDLKKFDGILKGSSELDRMIHSPTVSADDQLKAIEALLKKAKITGLVGNFIKVLAKNRRLFAVSGMTAAFGKLLAEHRGEVVADVTVAQALKAAQKKELQTALKSVVGKDVAINAIVDPSILGGMIVKVGSRQIDTSLRTKLSSLKLALKEVG